MYKTTIVFSIFLYFSSSLVAQERPNIILIMVDDMGYSDIGCYGGEIATPNLDRLAANGIRFTQFYNTSRCCPSRASLMTGLDHHMAGVGLMDVDRGRPGYRGHLVRDRVTTIPELLKSAGYGTYMVGKWHLGYDEGKRPLEWGFDRYYGVLEGATSFFEPGNTEKYPFDKKDRHVFLDYDTITPDKNYYATNRFTDYAQLFLDQHAYEKNDSPFFLYVAYNAPHWPLHALPKDIEKYEDTYTVGWDVIRKRRYERQVETGLLKPENTRLTKRPQGEYREEGAWPRTRKAIPAWKTLDDDQQKDMAKRMAVYAAMIDNIDQNVGRLISFLEERNELDNTLVLFLADNGGSHGGALQGYNALGTRGNLDAYGTTNSFISYGMGWANASNTPFRMYKCYVHEGGIASPLIAHWPGGMRNNTGTFDRTPAHITDILPSILASAGVEYPESIGERKLSSLPGISLLPLITNTPGIFNSERVFCWEHAGNKAIRSGEWKLVQVQKGEWELYDMSTDRCETKNLAEKYPGRVARMKAEYREWANSNYVNPPVYN